ncbi:hypothetical protein Pst134EA_017976 [Puccinia striiformis f. sp. tritici]|uniref:hypothetical protein n=1 Tax=Puccinia striiformis f. sp. tritici TaxID=168172 RepID=UPI0020074961|nr:hypothetical protein Pst134EA_017976 [Puccinia striiformis f. sp. tritici]KAH9461688.1 hypothetical protein Pst134EA_017976 [Puccinia striiformis f. sp. tritici]
MLLHPGALLTLSILVSQLPAGSSGRSLWKRIVINDVEVVPSSPSADLIEGSHINAIKENPSIEPADRKEMLILPHSPSTEFKEELHTNSNKEKPSDEPEGHKDLSMILSPSHSPESKQESKINGEKEKPLSEQEGYKDSLVLLPYPSIGFKIKEKEVGKEKPSKDLKGPKDLETNTAEDAEPRKGLTPLAEEPEETISLERFRIMAPRVTGIDPAEINDITRHFKVKYAGDRDVVPRRELIDLVYRWMTEWYKDQGHPLVPEMLSEGREGLMRKWSWKFDFMTFDELLEEMHPEYSKTKKNSIKKFLSEIGDATNYHTAGQGTWDRKKVKKVIEAWKEAPKSQVSSFQYLGKKTQPF